MPAYRPEWWGGSMGKVKSVFLFSIIVGASLFCAIQPSWAKTHEDLVRLRAKYDRLEKSFSNLAKNYLNLFSGLDAVDSETRIVDIANVSEGRLTTETGVPISTSGRSNQSIIYYTPYQGNNVSVFNGTNWTVYPFTERSLTLSGLTGDRNYDVFIYHNGTTLALELSAAWTNNVTRADTLLSQDGVQVKNSAPTRKLIGTIRTTSASQTQDKENQRFVWNYMNRVPRLLQINDTTDNWAYVTNGWRSARAQASNRVEWVCGDAENPVQASVMAMINASAANLQYMSVGVGLDTTTNVSSQLRGSGADDAYTHQIWGEYSGNAPMGYHYLQWVERAPGTSVTIYGDNGDATRYQSGVLGEISG